MPQDDTEAVKWFRRAADQRDTDAQYNLGNMYREGEGVPQDDTEAVKWYRCAADQGNARRPDRSRGYVQPGPGRSARRRRGVAQRSEGKQVEEEGRNNARAKPA